MGCDDQHRGRGGEARNHAHNQAPTQSAPHEENGSAVGLKGLEYWSKDPAELGFAAERRNQVLAEAQATCLDGPNQLLDNPKSEMASDQETPFDAAARYQQACKMVGIGRSVWSPATQPPEKVFYSPDRTPIDVKIPAQRHLQVNRAFTALLGYTQQDMIAMLKEMQERIIFKIIRADHLRAL
jgi:PAS domain-containing protein